jgi:putative inorganic carbon (hco3(-)) transporter
MPLRDVLVISVVLVVAVMAFRRAWLGVMLWTWISIMNPHRYTWGFAYSAPIAAIAGGVTLIGLFLTKERRSPFQGAPAWVLLAFTLWMTFSWLNGLDPADDYQQWNKVIKIYLMTFVALALLHTKHHIMAYAAVTTASIGLLSVKGGIFTVLTGGAYKVWGPPSSFIGDNNTFALAVIMTIPMLHFLQLQMSSKALRNAMWVVILLTVACVFGSHSRGALLALCAMSVVFWWRSRYKLPLALAIVVVVMVILPIMPEAWWDRMESIQTYQEDGSALGRLNAWTVAWHTARTHLSGAGMEYGYRHLFAQFGPYEDSPRAAHSIYFQILGNHGFPGLFLYLLLWLTTFRTAKWLHKNARHIPEAKWAADLGAMVQVALIGFAVGGAFLSLAYFDMPYNLMVMVVLARVWVERRAWETEPNIPFLEYAGLRRKPIGAGKRPRPAPGGRVPGVAQRSH